MPTCLFTDDVLEPGTSVEHTIPRSLGGRVRSQVVSSNRFNNATSNRLDDVLWQRYGALFDYLAPLLAREHAQGALQLDVGGEQQPLHPGGDDAISAATSRVLRVIDDGLWTWRVPSRADCFDGVIDGALSQEEQDETIKNALEARAARTSSEKALFLVEQLREGIGHGVLVEPWDPIMEMLPDEGPYPIVGRCLDVVLRAHADAFEQAYLNFGHRGRSATPPVHRACARTSRLLVTLGRNARQGPAVAP